MSSNAILTAIIAITEMYEETLVTFWGSLNLTSYMFNTEERNSGGNCDSKRFIDCFHINCSFSFSCNALILFEKRFKTDNKNRSIQHMRYIIRYMNVEPEFFKNYLES